MLITISIAVIVLFLVLALFIARHRHRKARSSISAVGEIDTANKQVYVGNLSYQATEQDLKDFFSKYGMVSQARVVRNYGSGRSKGFGFVTYATAEEAKKALAAHGQKYHGRTIVVRIAKPR